MTDGDNSNKPDLATRKELRELRRENGYMRRLVEQTTSRMLSVDLQSIAMRYELEQKRRGFRLMAELAVTLAQDADYENVFMSVSRRINATLNMQRTAVLVPDGDRRHFRPLVLQGYPTDERDAILARRIVVGQELLDPMHPILITAAEPVTRLGSLREALALPYLIAAPVMLRNEVAALLVTGRMLEQRPYLPPLGKSDVETVQTVSAYLAAILAEYRLRQAESLAKHDPLTHLPNLRGTTEKLRHMLALARRSGNFAATMFIDLDGFKAVNDTHGHAAGDIVLQIVADRLSKCVRESDFVGRIGGDEFVVVLSHIKRPGDAAVVAQKIIDSLSTPINAGGATCRVGASVGIAIFPDHGSDETALIRAADEAMYSVKGKGKNAFAFAER